MPEAGFVAFAKKRLLKGRGVGAELLENFKIMTPK
jgi:hypothetical protein